MVRLWSVRDDIKSLRLTRDEIEEMRDRLRFIRAVFAAGDTLMGARITGMYVKGHSDITSACALQLAAGNMPPRLKDEYTEALRALKRLRARESELCVRLRGIKQMLSALPEAQRQIVVDRDVSGYDWDRIERRFACRFPVPLMRRGLMDERLCALRALAENAEA
ncbi:MAG: hypothetical protein PHI27_04085 [Eubacteriales bacterium]|nr:hypothetical protein [Eubacteriales bacterium]MDD3881415.1 hypothetical protein [Eubacteriales bacterium]